MGYKTATTMILIVFVSGVLLSARSGPLTGTRTQVQPSTTASVESVTSTEVVTSTETRLETSTQQVLTTVTQTLASTVTATVTPKIQILVSPKSAAPNGSVSVVGEGFRPGSLVTITLVSSNATFLAKTEAGPDGTFRISFSIPSFVAPGNYTLDAKDSYGEQASVNFAVT